MEVVTKIGWGTVSAIVLSIGAMWVVSDADLSDLPSPDRRSTLLAPMQAPGAETTISGN